MLDSRKLKQFNTDLIRNTLKASEFGTKNSLSSDTGLSVATCGNILEELLGSGEVREISPGESTGGRQPRRFVYNEDFAFAALIYLRKEGGQNIIFASVINMLGQVVFEQQFNPGDLSIQDVEDTVELLLEKNSGIRVISLGVPGVVQEGRIDLCDFDRLSGTDIGRILSEKYSKYVTVENDVNATAMGYYRRLSGSNPESLVYIYYPEHGAAGAGIIVNGRVIKGISNFAGEVSYLPFLLKRDVQGAAQLHESFPKFAGDVVLSVNCILNPDLIVLSGKWFSTNNKKLVKKYLDDNAPDLHKPPVEFEEDIHDSYLDGLKYNALSELSCGFEVVERS